MQIIADRSWKDAFKDFLVKTAGEWSREEAAEKLLSLCFDCTVSDFTARAWDASSPVKMIWAGNLCTSGTNEKVVDLSGAAAATCKPEQRGKNGDGSHFSTCHEIYPC